MSIGFAAICLAYSDLYAGVCVPIIVEFMFYHNLFIVSDQFVSDLVVNNFY